MNEKLSNEKLEEIAKYNKQVTMDCNVKVLNAMATELLDLRADAETSQNHNAGVIDRIVEQLREAGYTGTLSNMIDQACHNKQVADTAIITGHVMGGS